MRDTRFLPQKTISIPLRVPNKAVIRAPNAQRPQIELNKYSTTPDGKSEIKKYTNY
jgi:hypothetical protein